MANSRLKGIVVFLTVLSYAILVQAETLEVTNEHPFYVNGNWIEAQDLGMGDILTTLDGQVKITNITRVKLDIPLHVYNLEAGVFHDFVVGKGLIVHNSDLPMFRHPFEDNIYRATAQAPDDLKVFPPLKGSKLKSSVKSMYKTRGLNPAEVVSENAHQLYVDLLQSDHKLAREMLADPHLGWAPYGDLDPIQNMRYHATSDELHHAFDLGMHTSSYGTDAVTMVRRRFSGDYEIFYNPRYQAYSLYDPKANVLVGFNSDGVSTAHSYALTSRTGKRLAGRELIDSQLLSGNFVRVNPIVNSQGDLIDLTFIIDDVADTKWYDLMRRNTKIPTTQ